MLNFLVFVFSIWCLIKNFSYSIYEYKENKNVAGAICVALLNILSFTLLVIMLWWKGTGFFHQNFNKRDRRYSSKKSKGTS